MKLISRVLILVGLCLLSACIGKAEREAVGVHCLLSCDEGFVRHLTPDARRLRLMRPSSYWENLGIRPGTSPVLTPSPSSPLATMDWWRVRPRVGNNISRSSPSGWP